MTYLSTPAWAPSYRTDLDTQGYIANHTRVWALRPDVYAAWLKLGQTVRAGMDPRRYELATLAAARRLGSSYCALAHGSVLRANFFDEDELLAIASHAHDTVLDPVDVAVMDFADRVAADPTGVRERDVAALRRHGLSDTDVLQVVLAVCIRRFFSGVLSAVGVEPDAFEELGPELRAALSSDIP